MWALLFTIFLLGTLILIWAGGYGQGDSESYALLLVPGIICLIVVASMGGCSKSKNTELKQEALRLGYAHITPFMKESSVTSGISNIVYEWRWKKDHVKYVTITNIVNIVHTNGLSITNNVSTRKEGRDSRDNPKHWYEY